MIIDEDKLTASALDEHRDFVDKYDEGNCTCFISPPCGSCTHPGNPMNLQENESAWIEVDE